MFNNLEQKRRNSAHLGGIWQKRRRLNLVFVDVLLQFVDKCSIVSNRRVFWNPMLAAINPALSRSICFI